MIGIPFVPAIPASMLVARKPGHDHARTRKIYMVIKGRETLVGKISEIDGKGAGYHYRLQGMVGFSKEKFDTIKGAKEALGAKL